MNLPSLSRLSQLVLHALANGLVIVCALHFGWTLLEVLTVYTGEWLLLVLIVYARVIIAKRVPSDPPNPGRRGTALLANKFMVFAVTLPFYVICVGVFIFAAKVALQNDAVPASSIRFISFCLAAFFMTHVVIFIQQAKSGAFDDLIPDRVVLMPFWRFPLLIVILVVALFMQDPQFAYQKTAFVVVLTLIAIWNTVLQRVDVDYVDSRLERTD